MAEAPTTQVVVPLSWEWAGRAKVTEAEPAVVPGGWAEDLHLGALRIRIYRATVTTDNKWASAYAAFSRSGETGGSVVSLEADV